MTRRFKSPEKLKEWRIKNEKLNEFLMKQQEEHERKMMDWAIDHAKTGPCIICPDGKVRRVPDEIYSRNKLMRFA